MLRQHQVKLILSFCTCRERFFGKEGSDSNMNHISQVQEVSLLCIPWQEPSDLWSTSFSQVCIFLSSATTLPRSLLQFIRLFSLQDGKTSRSLTTLLAYQSFLSADDSFKCSMAIHGCHATSQAGGLWGLITSVQYLSIFSLLYRTKNMSSIQTSYKPQAACR